MSYDYSVVLLIPAAHKDAINAYAEEVGLGPDNLSIPLVGPDGDWYGGHTQQTQAFVDALANPPASETDYSAAMAALVVSAVLNGDPQTTWQATLAEHGLTQPEVAI